MKNKQLDLFEQVENEVKKITTQRKKRKDSNRTDEEHKLLEFNRVLNQRPPTKLIKENPHFKSKYIPLQVVEIMLKAIFGSFQVSVAHTPVISEGNIIFGINLILIHPITKEKLSYYGVSAVPVLPANGSIQDVHPHLPAAKSYAIMNASKHIGQLFRAEADDYTKVFDTYFEDKMNEKKKANPIVDRLLKMIAAAKSKKTLEKYRKDVEELGDIEVSAAFEDKFKNLR